MLFDTKKSPHAKTYAVDQKNIKWREGFWQERFSTCANVTLPHILSLFEDKDGFFHQAENFRIAAGLSEGQFRGTPFGDGDFYKLMEGMMYAYAKSHDPDIDAALDKHIDIIGKAQQQDGYISTKQIIGERMATGIKRMGDIENFEVYNFGHLFTAACTHKRITGKDNFLSIAIKAAGYLDDMYREAARTKVVKTAVCPSHYMGLVELYRTTGDKCYLDLAKLSISLRDLVRDGTDDNQDRIPLRDQHEIAGHAVRATYLYAGVADLYLETGDDTLLPVLNDCWEDLFHTKLYITGGCGALYTGASPVGDFFKAQRVHQAFGYKYQLPNITAYNETCATLGHIFWTHRMFAICPQAKYFDLIERSTYNLALAAISLDGDKYFYENMLRRTKDVGYKLMWPLSRSGFFHCFCCPTNLLRSIMAVSEYTYMLSDDAVWLGLYGSSEAAFQLNNGAAFTLVQDTDYPWAGAIRFTFKDVSNKQPFMLKIRIPSWTEEGYISVSGNKQELAAAHANTYVDVFVADAGTAVIEAVFNMKVRYTVAHTKVEEAVNQVAVERGPLVYCMETPDADVETIDDLFLLSSASFEEIPYEIQGRKVTALQTEAAMLEKTKNDRDALYQPLGVKGIKKLPVRMIPYFAWDNRGFGEMRIWMPIMYIERGTSEPC
ncbi:MAG: Non-reducing end beta-L-arabinofuranosidase [Firmicutes bacterium ADurb.Bin193]|nr:MAG: Non-reducing end beta-L-arabinofuranosidase [Firmicutes bacterium ADurb.Bin193]